MGFYVIKRRISKVGAARNESAQCHKRDVALEAAVPVTKSEENGSRNIDFNAMKELPQGLTRGERIEVAQGRYAGGSVAYSSVALDDDRSEGFPKETNKMEFRE